MCSAILVMLFGNVTANKLEVSWKVLLPIEVTLLGIVIELNWVQPSKALAPIVVIWEGITTVSRPTHLQTFVLESYLLD